MTALYLDYFGLAEAPFSIAPAPRYLYMSQSHQDALAHLLYGVGGDGGFVLLTGEVGTGKTTVSRALLEQIPQPCEVAYVFNPRLTVEELLSTICAEFGIAIPPGNTSVKVFVDGINAHLLDAHARGRHSVLIIDEAQNLSADVLEQMRLLTNLETNERKLLQIILIGQPELAELLARPELRQLAQRIVARYHLGPLSRQEVAAYVQHRLAVAGTQRQLIPQALVGRLHRLSGGIPRVINVLCDRALLGAYAQGKERVDRATLNQAAREVLGHAPAARGQLWRYAAVGAVVLAALAVTLLALDRLPWQGEESLQAADAPRPATEPVPPAAQPPAPAPALPAELAWPADEPVARSKTLAYAALFQAWGAQYQGADPCLQAEALGLRCQAGRGGLDELRRADRPAVLSLQSPTGEEFFATLTELGPESATFVVAGQTVRVALDALASQWTGFYSLFWRVPPVGETVLRPGYRGGDVEWLAGQLARAQGREAEAPASGNYDAALVSQVRQFQLAEGLVPDGTAGPQTLIRLSNLTDDTAPKLLPPPPEP
jgi:general secretion pathway protein A